MIRILAPLLALVLAAGGAEAADLVPWRILPAESSLGFSAHDVRGGQVVGTFGTFSGTILFDPARLPASRISIDVDMTSTKAAFPEAADNLPKPAWLDIKAFLKAHYESAAIKKRPDGQFEAAGTLPLKGLSAPVTLIFNLPVYGPNRAQAKGTAKLSRGAFKLGQGDQDNDSLVADAVDLSFTVSATQP